MGKKLDGKKKQSGKHTSNNSVNDSDLYPFVSICTPTYNRRPFWPMAIQCFKDYDYPKDRMEWIIVDDGTDKIEDLVKDIPQVKYFKEEQQMVLGRKRNYMHEKSKGDIIVYQDDDDYYPPDRISHAVEKLMSDPKVLAGGSTVLFLYFKHIQQMYRFGPYSQNHATAGTFAFKRELLKQTRYDDFKALAEEKDFLKSYTIPFIQFDPLKTILVFSHNHNTFDKKKLLVNAPNPTCNPDMNITINHIVKSEMAKKFFLEDIDDLLAAYEPGDIKNKPEVLNQTKLIEELRSKQQEELASIRRETLSRQDVQQYQAEISQQLESAKRDMSRIFEVNKRLVERMKKIKHLLTEEDKKLMDETSKHPPVCNITILNPVLRIIQSANMCNVDPQSIQNIFNFITNHEMSLTLKINDTDNADAKFKCGFEFVPHPSVEHLYINKTPNSNNIDLNKALGGQHSVNFNEEDIQTIIEQTNCNRATAINALRKEEGDVISCIMNIDNHKCDNLPQPGQPSDKILTLKGDDIDIVKQKTGCNEMTAVHALANEKNDIEKAILNIDKYKVSDEISNQQTSQLNMPNMFENITHNSKLTEDDIQTIIDQTGCNKETAINALNRENNDVISCIMNIDKYKVNSNNQESEEGVTLSVSN